MAGEFTIGIVGAGIGGLTAAVCLQQRGFRVLVFEQAPELSEIGAGLTIGPNASRVLGAMGLEDQMQAMADATPHVGTLHHLSGRRLAYVTRGADEYLKRYGAVVRHIHRADLVELLERALVDRAECLRLDHQVVRVETEPTRVRLNFAHGDDACVDVLVGCDGLKSMIRTELFDAPPPEFTGYVAWRGMVERDRVQGVGFDPHFASYTAEGRMFGRYPVRHGTLINYVAVAREPDFTTESWTARADVSEVLAKFGDWHPDVVSIIQATRETGCHRWALHTRQPMDSWTRDRVTLLGDAAHPMTPFLGMGAAMAIEDAAVLSRCFEAAGADWADALARYERSRIHRANRMHVDSLERGESMLGSDPSGRAQAPGRGLDEVYRYDAMTVTV